MGDLKEALKIAKAIMIYKTDIRRFSRKVHNAIFVISEVFGQCEFQMSEVREYY